MNNNKLKIFKNNSFGFTLIEIIISTAIIALLTSIFLVDYHSANKRSELNMFIQQMASDIRLMQNYALSSYEYNGSISNGGWGFYIDKTNKNYILFADTDSNKEYTNSNELFKTVNFPNNFVVDSINVGIFKNSINMTFVPPKPLVNIGDNLNSYNNTIISLKDGQGNIKSIDINYFGLIDVEKN